MDLLNFRSNACYDSLIKQLVDKQIDHKKAIEIASKNQLFDESIEDNECNEYFANYFLNSLHLSVSWIINNPSQQIRSVQSTPAKVTTIQSSCKRPSNDKLSAVKQNLFTSKSDHRSEKAERTTKKSTRKFDPSKLDSRLNARLQKQNQIRLKNLNLNDEESFPKLDNRIFVKTTPLSSESKNGTASTKKQRRINPTLVRDIEKNFIEKKDESNMRKKLFESNRKIFDEAPELEPESLPTSRQEIELMTQDISKITPKKSIAIMSTTPASPCLDLQSMCIRTPVKNQDFLTFVQASRDKISIDIEKFNNLLAFYSDLIKLHLVPNVFSELDFLIQLLTRRCASEQSTEFLNAFEFCSNYHNCIYFAVKSLELVYEHTLIHFFDETFLKTLASNECIKQMSPEFQTQLLTCELNCDLNNTQDLYTAAIQPAFDFVPYQPETDSQENFPHDHSFHLFRKQRDVFSKLYDDWKEITTEKCFKQDSILNDHEFKFVNKVNYILGLSKDFANYFHLARLFLAKLLQCCTGQASSNAEQTIGEMLKQKSTTNQSTPNVCENKMKKLNKRFNQQDQRVLATQSSFVGQEIFFYEFIIASNNYSFFVILRSLLVSKITELNDPNLLIEAIELDENNLEIASFFATNLLNLQLLAKFLGLIVFMPFYSKQSASILGRKNSNMGEMIKNIYSDDSGLRLIINEMLFESLKRRHLISTIPWIIQFLNQMDVHTTSLVNYDMTIGHLVDIYRELGLKGSQYKIDQTNFAYLKLVFGIFFEKYFLVCEAKLCKSSETQLLTMITSDQDKTLDSFQLVNKRFISACFPRLSILKEIVKQCTRMQNNEIRKIKPLSLSLNESFKTLNRSTVNTSIKQPDKKHLEQIEFEENFFRLHADSLRKTVEFVAERLHSKCIKTLRVDVIKRVKKATFAKHCDFTKTASILEEIRQACLVFIKQFSESKVNEILDLLVSEHDFNEYTLQVAKSIALRMLMDKCLNWMTNNVNDSWIINETTVETTRRKQAAQNAQNAQSSESMKTSKSIIECEVPNISHCFNRVHDLICDLLLKNEFVCSTTELYSLLDELIAFRNASSGLNERTYQVIETTMMDLMIVLAAFQPKLLDYDLLEKLVSFYVINKLKVDKFLSARNVLILSLSKENFVTWDKYESILLRLVSKNIYSINSIETDVLSLLGKENEWNRAVSDKIASCINMVIGHCKSREEFKDSAEKVEIVDWLAWFCGQREADF